MSNKNIASFFVNDKDFLAQYNNDKVQGRKETVLKYLFVYNDRK